MKTARLCVIALVPLIGCGESKDPGGDAASGRPQSPIVTTVAELIREYRTDAIDADQKYKDKLVEVSGVVALPPEPGATVIDVVGYKGGRGTEFIGQGFVMADFDNKDHHKLDGLKKDQAITVKGACSGRAGMSIILHHCDILTK
jgi:hypothetical protein